MKAAQEQCPSGGLRIQLKLGQAIVLNDELRIILVQITGSYVRLAFQGPKSYRFETEQRKLRKEAQ
jgi:sRNA-binding carbon storage regulator CsrA